MNLWKELSAGPDVPNVINVIVETTKGARNEYAYATTRMWILALRETAQICMLHVNNVAGSNCLQHKLLALARNFVQHTPCGHASECGTTQSLTFSAMPLNSQ